MQDHDFKRDQWMEAYNALSTGKGSVMPDFVMEIIETLYMHMTDQLVDIAISRGRMDMRYMILQHMMSAFVGGYVYAKQGWDLELKPEPPEPERGIDYKFP